jgi:hypothetical protein
MNNTIRWAGVTFISVYSAQKMGGDSISPSTPYGVIQFILVAFLVEDE